MFLIFFFYIIVFGAKIGQNTFFEGGVYTRLPFMLSCGDNVVVEVGAKLETLVVKQNGDIAIDRLMVGDDAVIGSK